MNIFDKILKFEYKNNIGLYGMTNEFFALYLKKIFETQNKNILVVTPKISEVKKLNNYLDLSDVSHIFYNERKYSDVLDSTFELETQKANVINKILFDKDKKIVFTDIFSYLSCLPDKKDVVEKIINLKVNQKIDYNKLIEFCFDNGYEKVSVVKKTGDFGVRGFVFDIFGVTDEFPIRIEFFGDVISEIKIFDPQTQRTIKKIESVSIFPFIHSLKINSNVNISNYLNDYIVVFKDYSLLLNKNSEFLSNFSNEKQYPLFDLNNIKENNKVFYFDTDESYSFDGLIPQYYKIKTAPNFFGNLDSIKSFLKENNKTLIISLSTIDVNNFVSMFDFDFVITDKENIFDGKTNIIFSEMEEGFETDKYLFLTEFNLFNKLKKKTSINNFKYSTRIKSIAALSVGDYVVHALNGVGIYNGIKTLKKSNGYYDYLEVLYAKNDKLYIPISNINLISKYSAKEGYVPKINALNSSAWFKTKNKIREKIRYEAQRLLNVQAERKIKKGFSFSEDNYMQILFEEKFVYEETVDQLRAIREIKDDMESEKPMDRLLCGDVGYGKTEVALRAMFKAVLDNKQVIYLCPTTLLSKQQYEVACKRFSDFPVNIGLINRFVSPKKIKQILSDYKNGEIDILFGTHRVLSKDVVSKDLGLLVIDEEQRFGVAHKEKIKEYKNNVDVLTLTATPIPRTLQMSILGLKDLSFIATPPKNRKSIQTYVVLEDENIIKDVINREIVKGGKTFVLYNRVKGIYNYYQKLKKLLPDAKIAIAHGQMEKNELELAMKNFSEEDYDVLLCTTIIETGVDIPNVNTLIVIDSNNFGLSQLYQIRGRIGRGEEYSYAYLMYNKNKILTESAIKRLKTLKEFTELGSGFSIANRDLSIRGAGDILGAEQAGFIDSVGIDLYMKMLNDEVKRLKGIEIDEEEVGDISLVANHIKDSYVNDENLKIEIHRLINSIDSDQKMKKIKEEIEDRFGFIDNDMQLYMDQKVFEYKIKNDNVFSVLSEKDYFGVIFSEKFSQSLNFEDLFVKSSKYSKHFKFEYKQRKIILKISIKNENNYISLVNNLLDEIFI